MQMEIFQSANKLEES